MQKHHKSPLESLTIVNIVDILKLKTRLLIRLRTNGRTFTWQNGRQLSRITQNGVNTNYAYDGEGLRISKSGARNTEYIVLDGVYLGERTTVNNTTYLITYIYGAEGSVIGLDVNGTAYYFVKNLQGDVTSIINAVGETVAIYSYDAYGRITSITNGEGVGYMGPAHISNLNPFRYRGYMYDQESGFYYLTSRYYDPEVGRFLNADGMVSTGQGLDGYNMFAYCGNNPVNSFDPLGMSYEDMGIHALEVLIAGMVADIMTNSGNPYKIRITSKDVFRVKSVLFAKKAKKEEEERKRREITAWPTQSKAISSGFGNRLIEGKWEHHNGVDILPNGNTDVNSCIYGVVTEAGQHASMGNYVRIKSDKYTITYMHLESISVSVSQTVYAGDFVGIMGNTGYSFGVHLHFEVWDKKGCPIDPTSVF